MFKMFIRFGALALFGAVSGFAGSVGDLVWHDLDGDGVRDGSEPGLSGVVVSLQAGGSEVARGTTDGLGAYGFAGLTAGVYRVVFTAPDGMVFSPSGGGLDNVADPAGNGPAFSLGALEDRTNMDAGLFRPATLTGTLFDDLNGNGTKDPDETGRANVNVTLLRDGAPFANAVTDGAGRYVFAGLAPGDYQVRIPTPDGYVLSGGEVDATGTSGVISLASGATTTGPGAGAAWGGGCPTIDEFQSQSSVIIAGPGGPDSGSTTTADDNVIGGERDIEVEILNPPAGVQTVQAGTDPSDGRFFFGGISGQYSLRSCITWDGTDGAGATLDPTGLGGIDLTAGDTPYVQHGAFRLTTFADQLVDLRIEVYTDGGNMSVFNYEPTINVDETREIAFTDFVTELGGGADFTDIGAIRICVEDMNEADIDFELKLFEKIPLKAAIGNRVWIDVDADGIQDAGEVGLPGVAVRLYAASNTVTPVASATTDSSGLYLFDCVLPGMYFVEFDCPAGYKLSPGNVAGNDLIDSDADPVSKRTTPTTLFAGETDLSWDAGVFEPACLGDLVWLDSDRDGRQGPGPAGVAGATVRLLDGINPANVLATTNTDTGGRYEFCGLRPGKYMVEFEPPPGYIVTLANVGGDDADDSDITAANPRTPMVMLMSGDEDRTLDAGLYLPAPDYEIVKDRGAPLDGFGQPRVAEVGEEIVFTIVVTNTGETVLSTVPLDDTWDPAFLAFARASVQPTSQSAGQASWSDLGPLQPGRAHTLTVWFTALQSTAGLALDNKAATAPTTPPGVAEVPMKMDTAPYEIAAPAFLLIKERVAPTGPTADVGDTITFSLTVTNTGELTLTTVPLVDRFDPLDLEFVSASPTAPTVAAGRLFWGHIGAIDPGRSRTVTVNFRALRSTGGATKTNTVCSTPSTAVSTLAEQCDDAPYVVVGSGYTIRKVRRTPPALPDTLGGRVVFDIVVSNIGEVALTTVPLTDTYDASVLEFVTATPISPTTSGGGSLAWTHIGAIAPQASRTVSVTFNVIGSTAGAVYTNIACTAPSTATTTLPEGCAEAPYQVLVPGIELVKTVHAGHSAGAPCPTAVNIVDDHEIGVGGTEVTYCFRVNNTGDVHLTDIQLEDAALGIADITGFTFLSGSLPLAPGASLFYYVDSTISSDLLNTAQVTAAVSDPFGDPLPGFDPLSDEDEAQVELRAVAVGDYVWLDDDQDGIQDPEENPLPGVTVVLKNAAGGELDRATTDAAGKYLFGNLPPGQYKVCFELPDGCAPTIANAGSPSVSSRGVEIGPLPGGGVLTETPLTPMLDDGQADLTLDQGVIKQACIGDTVWEDVNANGSPLEENLSQLGLVGVRLILYNQVGEKIDEQLTTTNGYYKFAGLAPGCYEVEVDRSTVPSFLSQLTTAGERLQTCVEGGAFDDTLDFGFAARPTAVTLAGLEATAVDAGVIEIAWSTGSEQDHLGFIVHRSAGADAPREAVHDGLVLAEGAGAGAGYAVTDSDVADGTWTYWLEAVDTSLESEFHGPVSVVVGGATDAGLVVVEAPADGNVLVDGVPVPSLEVAGGLLVHLADPDAEIDVAGGPAIRIAAVRQSGGDEVTAGEGARVLDVSNPAAPVEIAGGNGVFPTAPGAAIRVVESP